MNPDRDSLEPNEHRVSPDYDAPLLSRLRGLLTVGFRRRQLVVVSFVTIFSGVSLFVLLRPAQYEATMKILVKRERLDPLVTAEESATRPYWLGVTEEELNSEVELLKSQDLLKQVVVAAGPPSHHEPRVLADLKRLLGHRGEEPRGRDAEVASAAQRVARRLEVKPLRKSNVIQVNYASTDPERSAAVLRTLADRYLDKHLAVHRPSGAFEFFKREADRYATQLEQAQARMSQLNRDEGLVSAQVERGNALQRLGDLERTQDGTLARIAETEERLRALRSQLASALAPPSTEVSGSAPSLGALQSTLLAHELKRMELLRDFQPDYPPVQEVEAQIAALRAAIAGAAQSAPPEYLLPEIARSRADLQGFRAHAAATARSISLLRKEAQRLEEVAVVEASFARATEQAEQSFMVASRKREEARMANALDAQRILNVAIAEEPMVPFEPSGPSRWLLMLLAATFAALVGVGLACVVDYFDPSFRSPGEVEASFGRPVLATIPALSTPAVTAS